MDEKKAFPEGYKPILDFYETERGIKLVKDIFERELARELNLIRVSAPRFLVTGTGLQDDLAGTQEPVSFKAAFTGQPLEMVHSLAKWKRFALGKYGFAPGTGLYTDMDAVRKDEIVDEIHSVYVDQWDWERVISAEERNVEFLKSVVGKIYRAIKDTERDVESEFPSLEARLPELISFAHAEDLEKKYPKLTPREREGAIARELGAVFLIGIGYPLKSGQPHDLRAADYDDWVTESKPGYRGLNGDIIIWDYIRGKPLELSSMGIRVDAKSLAEQLEHSGQTRRRELMFHKGVLEGRIPLSIGGGIGQSRLCMALLQKAHLGEVQSSAWPKEVEEEFARRGIPLL